MKNQKQNKLSQIYDPFLCTVVSLSIIIGFLSIASAVNSLDQSRYLIVQTAAALIGIVILILIQKFDYNSFGFAAPYIFAANVLLLVLVLIIGKGDEVGTRGWIRIGFVGIQPSEIVKVGFIITFAKHLSVSADNINKPKTLIFLLLHAAIIIFLVLLQPDYGTAAVFIAIMVAMLFISKISIKYIAAAFGAFAVCAPLMWFFLLRDYQKKRFFSFLNPEADPLGAGYHVSQSKIALGSGGAIGSGLFKGVQTQLGYLPEKQTDFIFAVIGEELGLWGTLLVLLLLLCIILKCFYIAQNSSDLFGELICVGIGTMFLFHTFENIGMCIGLAPVTGIPLPFISYGGSNMLASIIAVALVLNVRSHRRLQI